MNLSTYKIIIFILNESLFYIAIHLFFTGVLGKIDIKKQTFLCFFISVFISIINYIYPLSTILNLLTIFLLDLLISLNYSKKLSKNIPYTFLFILFLNFYELFVVFSISILFSVSMENAINNNLTYTISMFLSRFLLLLTSYIIYAFKSKLNISKNTTHFWIVITIFSLGSLYIFYYLIYQSIIYTFHNYSSIILIVCVIILFNITVFYLYNRQCKDYELHEENSRLSNYLKIQEVQQAETMAYLKKVSEMKYDMKNLFIGLSGLMETENYDEVFHIIHEKTDFFSTPTDIVNTPDNVINTILNYKISYAQNKNITVHHNLLLTNSVNIGYDDLSVTLGNAIDNAVEYLNSHSIQNPYISITISYDYCILNITISNPVCDSINIPDNYLIPSTKTEPNHGFGISSILKIVEKYNGMLSIKCENLVFTIDITLICDK